MNRIELIKAAFDLNNPEQYSHYSDDFQYSDELGSPSQDKDTWTALDRSFRSAFPDLSLVVEDVQEEGDGIVVTSRYFGTFTNDLDLSAVGLGIVPATGKDYVAPAGTTLVSFDNGKISKMHGLDTRPDAGVPGILRMLGVNMG